MLDLANLLKPRYLAHLVVIAMLLVWVTVTISLRWGSDVYAGVEKWFWWLYPTNKSIVGNYANEGGKSFTIMPPEGKDPDAMLIVHEGDVANAQPLRRVSYLPSFMPVSAYVDAEGTHYSQFFNKYVVSRRYGKAV